MAGPSKNRTPLSPRTLGGTPRGIEAKSCRENRHKLCWVQAPAGQKGPKKGRQMSSDVVRCRQIFHGNRQFLEVCSNGNQNLSVLMEASRYSKQWICYPLHIITNYTMFLLKLKLRSTKWSGSESNGPISRVRGRYPPWYRACWNEGGKMRILWNQSWYVLFLLPV